VVDASIDFVDFTHWAMRHSDSYSEWQWTTESRLIEHGYVGVFGGVGPRVIEVDLRPDAKKGVVGSEGGSKD